MRKLFIKLQAWLAYKSKCGEADALFKKDGKRRFVIPFNTGEMEVLTKEEALCLKKQNRLARDMSAKTIYGACFYFTDTNDQTSASKCRMPKIERDRRIQYYYTWFERHHSSK